MSDSRAPARAALAGNPSDGYGGAVLAVCIDSLVAVTSADLPVSTGEEALLVDAACARFAREFGVLCGPLGFSTSIPQLVGLGGSSAIVIACLRSLCAASGVSLDPVALAELALSIEVDDLGIAAGLQDRLVQAYGGLLFMEFSRPHPVCEQLDPALLPPLLVAWRQDCAEHSGVVHGDLRSRFRAGDPKVTSAMTELGNIAQAARGALAQGDVPEFRHAVDRTFDIRKELIDLNPMHLEMVDAAREAGAAVNYTGSGGAVVCVCDDDPHRVRVAAALRAVGCGIVAV